ncbi:tannase/feruloyl esterase family alpha/beta hydrolase [Novosphingobium sp. 9]|uniref:tannase/feruloyl esterase family alpha/beta hydrolase n=1 Tax=Novosphingobium sp. 9 TaxID=2025349 RepID=UPI0021B51796|nr:tannase/feruloyl esterase family alpha/beta hydrolase [Novosphingobium sp. 9]
MSKHRTLYLGALMAGTVVTSTALASVWAISGASASATAPEPVGTMPVFATVPASLTRTQSAFAAPCRALAKAAIPGGTVLSAQPVSTAKGAAFIPNVSYRPLPQTAAMTLPDFCRVTVRMTPVTGSSIEAEVWLPASAKWNQRYLGTGNGGPGGAIAYYGMVSGLLRGFAVANTDLGTAPVSTQATIYPATARPESGVDLGHRADHQMTVAAKTLIRAFYGHDAITSVFSGCSTGGQEALALAQRYPTDYDGILAGAPANNRTHLHAYFLWNFMAQQAAGGRLSAAKLEMVHNHVLAACAGHDGGRASDDFLTDPRQCHFDIETLPKCSGSDDGPGCLTQPEFTALRKLYAGPTNPRTGERIFAGVPFGVDWSGVLAHGSTAWQNIDSYTWNWTFKPGYDYRGFDFDRDLDQVDANSASYLNSNSADLTAFRNHGGKLILYTGTADPHIPYPDTMHYYERVVAANGGDLAATQQFARYFLAPGMGHCEGGAGFGDFGQGASVPGRIDNDLLLQLVRWVEKNRAPAPVARQFDAGGSKELAERPLCAYPAFPEYTSGNPSLATSYRCVPHPRGDVPTPAPRYLNAP